MLKYLSKKTGIEYTGNSQAELYLDMMVQGGMTYQEIGDVFRVTRSAVYYVLQNVDKDELEIAKKRDVYFTSLKLSVKYVVNGEKTLKDIADVFDTSNDRTIRYLKRMLPKPKRQPLSLHSRWKNMCKSIWGPGVLPGSNFEVYIKSAINDIGNQGYIDLLHEYYFEQKNNNRFKRGNALRKLGKLIQQNSSESRLVDVEVVQYA